ncbi:MAG TPA: tRNA threonylcarbamoyladenosine dehydratase [Spirochaetales bacterium]|nr:tRNA threonylcarbamoyladenosine dehydratase [Spirochaetales bacterium]HRY55566.1 tRNA threonylcarbamoyladenosine dehydratase [Spirochaetia bacterium]HRZ65392.1 tRNA threonylcarbamoyladenosine dehydratase [Spirochaetia bacterium]
MAEAFSRSALLVGEEGLAKLAASRVAVIGLGGVGSWAAEALARAGIGRFLLVDDDEVAESNLNRQLVASRETLGRPKVEVMAERILAVNPAAEVEARRERFGPDSAEELLPPGLAYAVDAIDAVSAKLALILRARELGIPILSAMGTGAKLDPTRLLVADISETSGCPLARVLRRELRRRGVESLQVVYSAEAAPAGSRAGSAPGPYGGGRRSVPGSLPFVPAAAGLIAASVVVRGILGIPVGKGS